MRWRVNEGLVRCRCTGLHRNEDGTSRAEDESCLMVKRESLLDENRWEEYPIGSRVFEGPYRLILLSLQVALWSFAYSRPIESTVYVSPKMALNRNASMIHTVMANHLLLGFTE